MTKKGKLVRCDFAHAPEGHKKSKIPTTFRAEVPNGLDINAPIIAVPPSNAGILVGDLPDYLFWSWELDRFVNLERIKWIAAASGVSETTPSTENASKKDSYTQTREFENTVSVGVQVIPPGVQDAHNQDWPNPPSWKANLDASSCQCHCFCRDEPLRQGQDTEVLPSAQSIVDRMNLQSSFRNAMKLSDKAENSAIQTVPRSISQGGQEDSQLKPIVPTWPSVTKTTFK